jgi:hypothetical protein
MAERPPEPTTNHGSERDICRKLLATCHLSVAERRALPCGRARFSVLVAAVQEALTESGWFPFEIEPGRDIGARAVLESRDDDLWVHEQHEVGMMRYSPIRSFVAADVSDALHAYVDALGGAPIDGVEIDWQR